MYSRQYKSPPSGAVKAFEDAYAKEEFLRRTATSGEGTHVCAPPVQNSEPIPSSSESAAECGKEKADMPKKTFLPFGGDSGDILLILLILLFLSDSDSENDKLVPIILGILLFF